MHLVNRKSIEEILKRTLGASSPDDDLPHLSASDDDDHSIDITRSSEHYTKLEVATARDISMLLRLFSAGMLLGLGITIVSCILIWTVYKHDDEPNFPDPPAAVLPLAFDHVHLATRIFLFLLIVTVLIMYSVRTSRLSKSAKTHQQSWIIVLLFSAALYFFPASLLGRVIFAGSTRARFEGSDPFLTDMYSVICHVSFLILTLFYIWASFDSYGLLDAKLGKRFYLTKAAAITGLMIYRIVLLSWLGIYTSELPLASIVAYLTMRKWFNNPKVPMSAVPESVPITLGCLTVIEVMILILIVRQAIITKRRLSKVNYVRYRTNQIGFRFSLYNAIKFYTIFTIAYMITLAAMPSFRTVIKAGTQRKLYLQFQHNTLGIEILVAVYVCFEAYVNLPADTRGFLAWFDARPATDASLVEPIIYRLREPRMRGLKSGEVPLNCFSLQTHIEMFNFAWLVYYHGTPKYAGLRQTLGLFDYSVRGHVQSENTDTHVLVIDGDDRIVVSFRGTNSARNLRTDLQAFHKPCSKVLPTLLKENDFSSDDAAVQDVLASREFRRAKLHTGFAQAYASISKGMLRMVKDLYDERERPVFLTGHSMGGALAVTASFDLFLKLGLHPGEIHVSTFGAPRVANAAFRTLYNEHVPNHWRVVIGPDIVTRLPKVGYRHVGKKVLLTASGDLFIDPSSFELKHWHGDRPSILYHRKASYMLAMRLWSKKHHGESFEPHFWDFPYTAEDSQRFAGANTVSTERSKKLRPTLRARERILSQAAMVDALDRDMAPCVSGQAVQNWARLVRRLLLSEELRKRLM